ncbi:MAG: hypothetical protein ABSD68_02890 [Candidatus Micrarchaeales archaeon]|jgi:hypothetical protein
MGGETKTVVKNDCVCELERTDRVSISLKAKREAYISHYTTPSVTIEHIHTGSNKAREYAVSYGGGDGIDLEFKVTINGKKINVTYTTYTPDYARESYDPFNEGVSYSHAIEACNVSYLKNKAIVRPNNLGSFENMLVDNLDLVNLFVISPKGILFNNQIFIGFAQDGSLMTPINKNLKRD